MPKLNKENIANLKNKSGMYFINSCGTNKPIYVGISKVIKHRLQSYYQKDDFTAHPTKKDLRKSACGYTVNYMSLSKAKKQESKLKGNMQFNHKNKN